MSGLIQNVRKRNESWTSKNLSIYIYLDTLNKYDYFEYNKIG